MRRIAVYSRQSTPNDDQVEEHVRWCIERVERDGGTVVGPFTDNGISGFKKKVRPGYEDMLAAIRDGKVDAVVAVTYDRLLRDPREGVRLAETLEAAKVTDVLFVDEGDINLRTADGRQLFRDRASAATHYSDRLGEKVRDANRRIARAGRWCGLAPYGYDAVNDHPSRRDGLALVQNKAEVEVIKEALAALKTGDANVNLVATRLRARGVPTGSGGQWNSKLVRRRLLSPAIAGLAEYQDEVLRDETGNPLPVTWEPIISPADHELLKERLATNHVDRHPDSVNLRHPLAGILRCGRCGVQMYGATLKNEGRSRYTCSSERGGCGRVSVSAQYVEPLTVGFVEGHLIHTKSMPTGEGVAVEVHEAAAAELSAIARDRAQLNALSESKMFTAAELRPKFTELKKRERKAKNSLARPVSVTFDVKKMAATIRARYEAHAAGDRDAAQLLHDEVARVVRSVTVAPIKAGARKNVFDPSRLTFTLLDGKEVGFPTEATA